MHHLPDHFDRLLIEAGLGATALYTIRESDRPRREGSNEGGMIPNPQPYTSAENIAFTTGRFAMAYVLWHIFVIPVLVVWAAITGAVAIIMAHPFYHGTSPYGQGHWHWSWYLIAWLAFSGLIGLRIFIGLMRAIDGRRVKRRASTIRPSPVRYRSEVLRDDPPDPYVLPPRPSLPTLPPSPRSLHR